MSTDKIEKAKSTSVHPEAEDLLRELGEFKIPSAHAQSPEGARKASNELFQRYRDNTESTPVGDVHTVLVERSDGEVPVRVYEPDSTDGPFPCLLHIHGGGWVRGSLDTYDEFCRYLTNEVNCITFSVDYRLAPEYKFPTAVEDSYAAAQWIVDFGADLYNGDPDRLAVIGDSAGGNLSAAVSLMARNRGGPKICHQVLLYPALNHAFDTLSYEEHADDPVLPLASMEWYWDHYLNTELDGKHPYASPFRAKDLSNLPSATVITAGFDPLRDEGRDYALRLKEAGVPVSYKNYEDMPHIFLLFPDSLSRARDAYERIASELRDQF